MAIGRLHRVALREVWPNEAVHFTTWLQDNLDVLSEVLDLRLTSAEREQAVGSFSVDLVAEDEAGSIVVIENQLGKSDHDHLGKVITYLTAIEAQKAIWIVGDPRPEHIGAIVWLNESSPAAFYLVKLEAVRIGESLPAPLFTLIVGPSVEVREAGRVKKEVAEQNDVRLRFWEQLHTLALAKTSLHAHASPRPSPWLGTGIEGPGGLTLSYVIRKSDSEVHLYIDRGTGSRAREENDAIFDQLKQNREVIDETFGDSLEWEASEKISARRIKKVLRPGGYELRKPGPPSGGLERIPALAEISHIKPD